MTQLQKITSFQAVVWNHYYGYGRQLPWRQPAQDGTFNPYHIVVSEMMLQQTQVSRVIPKYLAFLKHFPDIQSLADAPLRDVLILWSGLGYNRRAKYLWQTSKTIVHDFEGTVPAVFEELTRLPGIGKNTAAAVMAYAYNLPVVFIETNIRTVFIRHFFSGVAVVDDKDLVPLITATLDHELPREWYWALMDYGSHLKATEGNYSRVSRQYSRQPAFEGSHRQLRGRLIRLLSSAPRTMEHLKYEINDPRTEAVLQQLRNEQMVSVQSGYYHLSD